MEKSGAYCNDGKSVERVESAQSFEIQALQELQSIKGVSFPTGVKFHQLLVTGPPGSGKSTLLAKIGGWPEEGYLDLSSKRWWATHLLGLRPREVHLGLPFSECDESQAIFDEPWIKGDCGHQLELDRIKLPPQKQWYSLQDWRKKFVFEFILPCAGELYEQRKIRARRMTHRVDEQFDLQLLERQLETLWMVARFLHHCGFFVYIREGIEGTLSCFTAQADSPDSGE